jgi:hypothetical protein
LATRVEYDGGRDFPWRSRPKVHSSLLPQGPHGAGNHYRGRTVDPDQAQGLSSLFGNNLIGVTPFLHYVVSGRYSSYVPSIAPCTLDRCSVILSRLTSGVLALLVAFRSSISLRRPIREPWRLYCRVLRDLRADGRLLIRVEAVNLET